MNVTKSFIQYLHSCDISPRTITTYESQLKYFGSWFVKTNGEDPQLQDITPTDIKDYKQYLQVVKRYKASTVNGHLAALSALFRWGQEQDLIQINPMYKIKRLENATGTIRWLDKREQHALRRVVEMDFQISRSRYPKRWLTRLRDAAMTIFYWHTGLRLEEGINLHIDDVSISPRKGSVLVRNGKGNKQRTVPLSLETRNAVEKWLKVRPNNNNYLWITVNGDVDSRPSGREVQRVLKRYARAAGLEKLTPHMLRHTFAKNLINNKVGLEEVAKLLGHSNLNTTRVYITPSEKDLEDAISTLDE